MTDLTGRAAVVTGGARGITALTAPALGRWSTTSRISLVRRLSGVVVSPSRMRRCQKICVLVFFPTAPVRNANGRNPIDSQK